VGSGVIKAAVIKAVLIDVINVPRVKLLTCTDMRVHDHLAPACTPTLVQLFLLDIFPFPVRWMHDTKRCSVNAIPQHPNIALSLGIYHR